MSYLQVTSTAVPFFPSILLGLVRVSNANRTQLANSYIRPSPLVITVIKATAPLRVDYDLRFIL